MNETERMKELVKKLNEAAKAYYQEDREIMSNLEYDTLYDELQVLEEKTGVTLAGSPTTKVGYEAMDELPKGSAPQLHRGSQNAAVLEDGRSDRRSDVPRRYPRKGRHPWKRRDRRGCHEQCKSV